MIKFIKHVYEIQPFIILALNSQLLNGKVWYVSHLLIYKSMLHAFIDLYIQQIQEQYKVFKTEECSSGTKYKFCEYQTISWDPLPRATHCINRRERNSCSKLLGSDSLDKNLLDKNSLQSICLREKIRSVTVFLGMPFHCTNPPCTPSQCLSPTSALAQPTSVTVICIQLPLLPRTEGQECPETFPEASRVLVKGVDA